MHVAWLYAALLLHDFIMLQVFFMTFLYYFSILRFYRFSHIVFNASNVATLTAFQRLRYFIFHLSRKCSFFPLLILWLPQGKIPIEWEINFMRFYGLLRCGI